MINIIVKKDKLFYSSDCKVVLGNRETEKLPFTRKTLTRDRMINLIARKISHLDRGVEVRLHSNVDTTFTYDVLFKLRNEYNIDLQKGA